MIENLETYFTYEYKSEDEDPHVVSLVKRAEDDTLEEAMQELEKYEKF